MTITVLELVEGTYEERVVIQGSQRHALTAPFPITLAGDDLRY